MSNAFVSLKNVSLAYGSTIVVPELNLDMRKGELISLLGPSGCGKTTTMRAIAGLMPLHSGSVSIDNVDVSRTPANKRGIGLVFQSYALFPHLNAFENAAFGLRLKKLPEAKIREKVNAGLEKVGLSHLADRKPGEMSGGQQQRLSLARSLVMEPKVLLLDEPLSNLDARLRLDMRNELQRVQRETGITMIFVTHDQAEALALSDRIVLMKDGKIEQHGTPDELYGTPTTTFAADFFGFENILEIGEGTLIGKSGSLPFASDHKDGHLAWRPAAVDIGTGGYIGKVTGVAFAGEHREYVLDTPCGQISAAAPAANTAFNVGDEVSFNLSAENAHWIEPK